MKAEEFIYLSRSDVEACGVTWDESLAVSEKTYSDHAKGLYEMPPKPGVHPKAEHGACDGAFLHAMPGFLPEISMCGMKWVGVFGHNKKKFNIPALSSIICLNDVTTGYPVAVMEGGLITAIRTGQGSAVGAKWLAKADSEVLGVVGAGEQGRNNVLAICNAKPTVKVVKLYDLYPEFCQGLIDIVAPQLPGIEFKICASAEEVIRDSDIIVTAAPLGDRKDPVYMAEWVKPGATVIPVHMNGWPFDFCKAHKCIIDDWNQFSNYMFGPGKYWEDRWEMHAQLGDIINGTKVGRENDEEIIINFNLGIALQDISLGTKILEIAKEKGLGKVLSLW